MRTAAAALLLASAAGAEPSALPVIRDPAAVRQLPAKLAPGKPVVLHFWATWCAPCVEELPALAKIFSELEAGGGRVVFLSLDKPADAAHAKEMLDALGAGFAHYLLDAPDADPIIRIVDPAWEGALPATFVYDRKGARVASLIGDTDLKALRKAWRKASQ
jgi:thiol-disulfide isomerase/thioredoxin